MTQSASHGNFSDARPSSMHDSRPLARILDRTKGIGGGWGWTSIKSAGRTNTPAEARISTPLPKFFKIKTGLLSSEIWSEPPPPTLQAIDFAYKTRSRSTIVANHWSPLFDTLSPRRY